MADGRQGLAPPDDSGANARRAAPPANSGGGTACCCWPKAGPPRPRRRPWNENPRTIGRWLAAFGKGEPAALIFEQTGGPPALGETQQAELKATVQELPEQAGIKLANWYWRGVQQFVPDRFGIDLSRSICSNYLNRLGFAFKRRKKRLFKADEANRESFVSEYAALMDEACQSNAKTFFDDEAHFRADAELRGKWVLRGGQALVDSSSPSYGVKASYYSAVSLETGEVEWMELEGNSNSETSAVFLGQLRERHCGRLNVIWDNAPAHRGEAVREYLGTPGLHLSLVNPRFHEGRLCQAIVRTSMPMRRSGAGREGRPPETFAWGPKPWFRRKSATSRKGWPCGKRRSSVAAGPSRNQDSCVTPIQVPNTSHMHIPLWL